MSAMDLCGLKTVFFGILEGQFDSSEAGRWQYALMKITFPNKKGRFQELIAKRAEKMEALKVQARNANDKFLRILEPEKRKWEKWVKDADENNMSKRRLSHEFALWLSSAETKYNEIKKIEKSVKMLQLEIDEFQKNIDVLDEVMERAKNSQTYIDMKSVYRAGVGLQTQGAPLLGEASEEQFEYDSRKQEEEDRIIMHSEEREENDTQRVNDFQKFILKALTGQEETPVTSLVAPSVTAQTNSSSSTGLYGDDNSIIVDNAFVSSSEHKALDSKKKKPMHTYY